MLSTLAVKPLKYGILNDTDLLSRFTMPLKASEVFNNQSGKFVARDTASADVAVAGDTEILGWANTHAHTVGTGESAEIYNDIRGRFLIGSTSDDDAAAADRGKTCDLEVVSNVQTANTNASTTDVIVIYDFEATLNLVEVGLNPLKMFATGVI